MQRGTCFAPHRPHIRPVRNNTDCRWGFNLSACLTKSYKSEEKLYLGANRYTLCSFRDIVHDFLTMYSSLASFLFRQLHSDCLKLAHFFWKRRRNKFFLEDKKSVAFGPNTGWWQGQFAFNHGHASFAFPPTFLVVTDVCVCVCVCVCKRVNLLKNFHRNWRKHVFVNTNHRLFLEFQ